MYACRMKRSEKLFQRNSVRLIGTAPKQTHTHRDRPTDGTTTGPDVKRTNEQHTFSCVRVCCVFYLFTHRTLRTAVCDKETSQQKTCVAGLARQGFTYSVSERTVANLICL